MKEESRRPSHPIPNHEELENCWLKSGSTASGGATGERRRIPNGPCADLWSGRRYDSRVQRATARITAGSRRRTIRL